MNLFILTNHEENFYTRTGTPTMRDDEKSKDQLIEELATLRVKYSELEEKSERAMEMLLKSHHQLYTITDNLPVFVNFVNAHDLSYKFVNKPFADAFGMSPKQMHGKCVKDILGEQSYMRALPYIESARSGERILFENIVSIHGEPRCFSIEYIPDLEKQGEVDNITVLAIDITDYKRKEEELRLSEERFKNLSSIATEGIMIHEGGVILDANKAFANLLGYNNPEDIIGKEGMNVLKLTPESEQLIQEHLRTHSTESYDVELIKLNGRIIPAETFGRDIYYHGRAARLVYMRDITERKLVEDKLKEKETLQRILLDNLLAGIVIVDPVTRVIESVNAHVTTLFGASADYLVGHRCHSLLCPAIEGACPVCDLGKVVDNSEREMLCADGGRITILKTVKRAQLNGQEKLIECFVDITERKRVEQLLRIQHELLLDLNSCTDLHQGLNTVLKAVLKLEYIDCGGVYMVNSNDNSFDLVAYHGLSAEFVAHTSHYTIDSSQVRNFISGIARYGSYAEISRNMDEVREKEGLRALATIPIMGKGQLIAILNLASHSQDSFPTETRRVLETIAVQIGGTLLRLRTDASLRMSEGKYRALVENAYEIIVVAQGERLVFVNRAATKITGYSDEELTSGSFAKLIHPADREFVQRRYFDRVKGENVPQRYEFRIRHKNGNALWVEISTVRIIWEGKPATLNFILDITARKQSEEALRESEEIYRLLFDATPVGTGIVDMEGNLLAMNRSMHDITMYSLEKQNAINVRQTFSRAEDRERMLGILRKKKRVRDMEVELIRRDGSTYFALLNVDMIHIADKPALLTTIRDITEHKLAGEALQKSEERYRELFNNANLAIFQNTLEGKILAVNPEFARMFGYNSCEEVLTTVDNAADLFADPKRSQEIIRLKAENPDITTFENLYLRKNGSTFTGKLNVRQVIDSNNLLLLYEGFIEDITDRKKAADDLRQSQALLQSIFRSAPVGIGVVRNRVLGWVNERLIQITGYTASEMFGKSSRMLYPTQEEFDYVGREKYKQIRAYGNGTVETRWVRKDGQIIDLLLSSTPMNIDNLDEGVVFTALDITERKQAEVMQRESEERFRAAFQGSPNAIAISRQDDGVWIDVNQAAIDLFMYTREEAIGKSALTTNLWVDLGDRKRLIKTLSIKGEVKNHEVRLRRKDGSIIIGSISVRVFKLKNVNHLLLVTEDITERKRVEEHLRRHEARYKTMLTATMDGFALYSSEGRFFDVNDQLCEILGYSRDELYSLSAFDVSVKEDKRAFQLHSTNIREWGFDRFETRHKRKDGVEIETEVSVHYIPGENCFITFFRELTEKKRLEGQLLQAQKMEAVGRLAGGVAHDFNNMLTIILGRAEIALMTLDSSNPVYTSFKEIQNAGNRSADIIRQLLGFARKQTVAPKVLNLNEIIEGMLKMLRRLIGEDINLSWKPDHDLRQVKIDPSQIDQVLANLCVNARDAISDVGKITIETANAVIDQAYCADHTGFLPGKYVMLAVSDNGCGMEKEILMNIFEPFFTTKEIGKGTGLGLATVYGIVKQNNGFINVYSEPGSGTTFKIYLKQYWGENDPVALKGRIESFKSGSETVLLVEDEPEILKLGKTILEKLGYTVIIANTPGEAIRLAEEFSGQIHLLMTDVVMPEMNGRDLAKNLLSRYPHLKSLFMSGYTANVIAHHGVLDDGVHFIQKPFLIKDLAAKVREALSE